MLAQSNVVFEEWATTRGFQEYFYKNVTQTDASGNVYVAGATLNANGDYDLLITKFDRNGNTVWNDTIAGVNGGHDFATALEIDHSDNVVVCGSVSADTAQSNNMLVVKYDSSGNEQWRLSHDNNGNNEGAAALCIDQQNNIYLTGASHEDAGYADMITLKLDSTSAVQWEKIYDYNQLHDVGVKIALSGSRVVVTGVGQYSAITWQAMALSYLQVDGTLTGTSNSGSADPGVEEVADLVVDQNENIYLVGSTVNTGTGYDFLVIKLDEDLNVDWIKEWDGANGVDKGAGVRVANNGDVFVTGTSESNAGNDDIVLIKYNSAGDLIWSETYNGGYDGDDAAASLEWDGDDGLFVAGSSFVVSNEDYITLKFDTSGTKLWEMTFNSPYNKDDKATNKAIDSEGDLIVSGQCAKDSTLLTYYTVKYAEVKVTKPAHELPESELLSFERNMGQLRDTSGQNAYMVKYFTEESHVPQYFQDDRLCFITNNYRGDTILADTLDRFDLVFDKHNEDVVVRGFDKTDFYKNYYLSSNYSPVLRNNQFQSLYYHGIWNGIDMLVQLDSLGSTVYTLVLPPQISLNAVALDVIGHQYAELDTAGFLKITTALDTVVFTAPEAYTIDNNGTRQATTWTPVWSLEDTTSLGINGTTESNYVYIEFRLSAPNASGNCSADFDPNNCNWSTQYGVGTVEILRDMCIDEYSNKYLLIRKSMTNGIEPLTFVDVEASLIISPPDATFTNALVYTELVKLDSDEDIEWILAYGGFETVGQESWICVPYPLLYERDNIYFGGYTNIQDLFTVNADQEDPGETDNGYVARCDLSGEIDWSTYYGRDRVERVYNLAYDHINENLLVTGLSGSGAIEDALTSIPFTGGYNNAADMVAQQFLVAYNEDFQKVWLTYLGDPDGGSIALNDVAVVGESLYVCGDAFNLQNGVSQLTPPITSSLQFPIGGPTGAHIESTTGQGIGTGLLLEIPLSDYSINWSTFIAGSPANTEFVRAVSGRKTANSTELVLAVASFSESLFLMDSSTEDGFYIHENPNGLSPQNPTSAIVKFNNRQPVWATYAGANRRDLPNDLWMDFEGNIFLTGESSNTTSVNISDYCQENEPDEYPLCSNNGAFFIDATFNESVDNFSTDMDGYVIGFHQTNELLWSTYFGGENTQEIPPFDHGVAIAQDINTLDLYVAGTTQGGCFPELNKPLAYNQDGHGGGVQDAYVAEFDVSSIYIVTSLLDSGFEDSETHIFPNPGKELVTLVNTKDPIQGVDIYDTTGRLVFSSGPINSVYKYILDLSPLNNGTYFFQITTSAQIKTAKWIKL